MACFAPFLKAAKQTMPMRKGSLSGNHDLSKESVGVQVEGRAGRFDGTATGWLVLGQLLSNHAWVLPAMAAIFRLADFS